MNPEQLQGVTFTHWCSGCGAEPAVTTIELRWDEKWVPVQIGENCLTRVESEGKIEE